MSKLALDKLLEPHVPLVVQFRFSGPMEKELRIIYPDIESEFFCRIMDYNQRFILDQLIPSSPEKATPREYYIKLIQFCYIDSSNTPIFDDDDLSILSSKPDPLITALTSFAMAHNRLTFIEKAKLVKKSKGRQHSLKSSDSPKSLD